MIPIADVAHIVHGPIACAGSSLGQPGNPFVRARPSTALA